MRAPTLAIISRLCVYNPLHHRASPFQTDENDVIHRPGFSSEQSAAGVLGYTKKSWDNKSGKETLPATSEKKWSQLTDAEKDAAKVLGFNKISWDNKSGMEKQPASTDKKWSKLSSSGEDCTASCLASGTV